ncbi:hypothetical protein E6W39_07615 [Kitasatospora acidiphila]|uniref:Uncharacterized protein n=1 Tax=Kitasatospora acidiphila TaxID=2567942 RepID=A0A540VZK8_9ACTN|nr:hypothetical protein E6W39_07615 [Kitasatospora acidiphila]
MRRAASTVGALRQAGYRLGRVCDELVMDAVAPEFEGPPVVKGLVRGRVGFRYWHGRGPRGRSPAGGVLGRVRARG